MDANELKRLLDENCDQLARILEECRSGPAVNVRVVDVMGSVLQEFRELEKQVFVYTEQNEKGDNHEPHEQQD